MQSFAFEFDHIKGTKNIVANWQSRLFMLAPITRSSSKKAARVVTEILDDSTKGDLALVDNLKTPEAPPLVEDLADSETLMLTQMDMLKAAHSDFRSGHFGSLRTYNLLNKKFQGHGLSMKQVEDFVRECPVCQKVRLGMETSLVAITRHLKVDGPRRVVGIDY